MATTATTLTQSYQLIGAGSHALELRGSGKVRLHFGASLPADGVDTYITLESNSQSHLGDRDSYFHSFSSNVYARLETGYWPVDLIAIN